MKRALMLLLLAALLLTGCAVEKQIVVDHDNNTISDGEYTYQYTDAIVGDTRTIEIQYPDGGIYQWKIIGMMGVGSGTDNSGYTDGDVLVDAILNPGAEPEKKEIMWPMVVIGGVAAALGLLIILRPELVWNYTLRNIYDEDISNYAMYRFISGGIGAMIVGVGMILLGLRVFI